MGGLYFFGVLIVVWVDSETIMGDFFFKIKEYIEDIVFAVAILDTDPGKKRGLGWGGKVGFRSLDARMG